MSGAPLSKGAGAVRCTECHVEARANGTGAPIVLRHEDWCSEANDDLIRRLSDARQNGTDDPEAAKELRHRAMGRNQAALDRLGNNEEAVKAVLAVLRERGLLDETAQP